MPYRAFLDGAYNVDGIEVSLALEEHAHAFDGRSVGWYAQAVYKFAPEWRIGTRYSRLSPPGAAGVGSSIQPHVLAHIMGDWTTDDFGQVRLQYNRESLERGAEDNQIVLQYTVTLGGHEGHDH